MCRKIFAKSTSDMVSASTYRMVQSGRLRTRWHADMLGYCSAQCLCHPKASTNLSMKEHWPARATLPDISMLIRPADQQRHVHKVYGSVQHLDSEASTLLANHVVQRFSGRRLTGPCNWSQSPHQTAPKRLKKFEEPPKVFKELSANYQQTVGSVGS